MACGRRFDPAQLHHNVKSQPLSGWDFFARSPSVGAVSGPCLLSTPLRKSPFPACFPPFSLSVLCGPLEHSRPEVVCWRGFAAHRFASSPARERATETAKGKKRPNRTLAVRSFIGPLCTERSGQIESVGVHDLGPSSHEVVDELLAVVVLGIDLGVGAQD